MPTLPLRPAPERRVFRVALCRIHPQAHAPRRQYDADALAALAESIRRHGLLTPLLLRREGAGYELIAGERRLRAMEMLGWTDADAILLSADSQSAPLLSLIENLQREELHFLDQAEACRRILQGGSLRQNELAAAIGKSPSALANLLRLLHLSEAARSFIRDSALAERHARALLRLPEARQLAFARIAARDQLSVRRLEAQIDAFLQAPRPTRAPVGVLRDSRLVINALKDTVRQLNRIGIPASSRVEAHEDSYDVIVTIRAPRAAAERNAL